MKVAAIVMLMCVAGVDSNIHNFFSMLSDSLQDQFQNVWDVIKHFVRRPIRYKKIHRENDQTTTYSYLNLPKAVKYVATTDISTTKEYTLPPDMMYYFQRTKHKKVLLPIIEVPKWKTRGDWMDIQKNLGFFYRGGDNFLRSRGRLRKTVGDVTTVGQLDDEDSNEDDDEDIGVMMFV